MQHTKVISLTLSILFVLVLTNIAAICVADANSTYCNNTLFNVTGESSKNLTAQDYKFDNYVEGYR